MFQNKVNNNNELMSKKKEEAIIDDMVFSDKDSQEDREQVCDLVDAIKKKDDTFDMKHNELQ